jgi:cobalt/nickel transport system ATP-binding protein
MTALLPAFALAEVHYAYRGAPALDGLSLTIPAGQRVALLGANGSGKSTLLRLLDALIFPAAGRVTAFGAELTEEAMADEATALAFRRRTGLVFQNPDVQLFNPTVFDELAFGPLQLGWPKDDIRARTAETLAAHGLTHLKDRPPHRLSGGEKKRVALASVMILEPDVLLLDEPTAALDPASACRVIDALVLARGTGRTVITATHDLDIVEDIADHVVVLAEGRVVTEGSPQAILADADLLARTGLAHAHLHRHGQALVHAHQHRHRQPDG